MNMERINNPMDLFTKAYKISLRSITGRTTKITIETNENLSETEIANILEEIRMNLAIYIESK